MDEDPEKNDQCDFSDAALIEQEDREWISEIRKDLNKTPEIFVLNNVLMCTMFLRNYKEWVWLLFIFFSGVQNCLINILHTKCIRIYWFLLV